MAIGSLVHSGLENWGRNRRPGIAPEVIAEIGPSPEALVLAGQMVQTYINRFPNENFVDERTETPMLFEIPGISTKGFALVDNFFYNPCLCEIESGVGDEILAIQQGWWIREYKTKDAQKPRGVYQQAWQTNMQADFQIHALSKKVGQPVQGIFVCVLERPRLYIPHRKCKGCGEMLELATYLPTGTGDHACPLCGNQQKLKPYAPKIERRPDVYRFAVTRTKEQLDVSMGQILQVAMLMEEWKAERIIIPPNKEACVVFNNVCEYFDNHTYDKQTSEDVNMMKKDTTKYARLQEMVQIV
jgi:hypothetical protein